MDFYKKHHVFEEDEEQIQQPQYDILTPKEVQDELAIGRNTFYKLVNSGQLPAFRIGKLWRVRREDIKKLI